MDETPRVKEKNPCFCDKDPVKAQHDVIHAQALADKLRSRALSAAGVAGVDELRGDVALQRVEDSSGCFQVEVSERFERFVESAGYVSVDEWLREGLAFEVGHLEDAFDVVACDVLDAD